MIGFAWFALFSWPIAAIVFFKKWSLPAALLATLLGGYLLLPSSIGLDLPLLPPLDKVSISVFMALILSIITLRTKTPATFVAQDWFPKSVMVRTLIVLLVLGVFGTIFTNTDVVSYGRTVLPGLTFRDIISGLVELSIPVILFILGRKFFASPETQVTFLKVLVCAALAYSLLALWEVRMSPQLHRQIYGFFPHSFLQQMRDGGFRPILFLGHGLAVALFFVFATLAAAVLTRVTTGRERSLWMLLTAWFVFVLVLCKTMTAIFIISLLLPVALFLGARAQLIVATSIVIFILSYPALRSAELVPVDRIMEFALSVNEERAESLNIRFVHEKLLLEKAQERPAFGWGGWARNRIFNEAGQNVVATDGAWVIALGVGGWVRYLAYFGLFCWPVIAAFLRRPAHLDLVFTGIALLICARMINSIPNSGFEPFIWLGAGGLVGRLERKSWTSQDGAQPLSAGKPKLRYARDFNVSVGAADTRPNPQEKAARKNTYRRLGVPKGHL